MNEWSQYGFLKELRRIASPEGRLLLTIHGERALERAKVEKAIFDMLSVDGELFAEACDRFGRNRHAFILQHGHLTESPPETARMEEPGKTALWKRGWRHLRERYSIRRKAPEGAYEYGITFIPEKYVAEHWSRWFRVEEIRRGAIHNFQDIVVLRPRKEGVR